jgi:hypothetical protein
MTHEALDTPAARGVPQVTQGGVDSRRTIAATMRCIEAPDLMWMTSEDWDRLFAGLGIRPRNPIGWGRW